MQASVLTLPATAARSIPYLVWKRGAPYYKRRVPPDLRSTLGCSTVTKRLDGHPDGSRTERSRFLSSYSRIHQDAERQIAAARQGNRKLTHIEQLGVAGAWAKVAGPQDPFTVDRKDVAAILQAAIDLGVVLPSPVPPDWQPGPVDHPDLIEIVSVMAHRVDWDLLPGVAPEPPSALLNSDEANPSTAEALAYFGKCVRTAHEAINTWTEEARRQLNRLGVIVDADQVQAVAARIATTSAVLGEQAQQVEMGQIPPPIQFPEPPEPTIGAITFNTALQRWISLRSPAAKTVLDTERRLDELAAHIGHDRLDQLTPDQILSWRDQLLKTCSGSTTSRKLGLVRAVLTTAAADGLPIPQIALDRLSGRGLQRNAKGTTRQRRPFTLSEATTLWSVSRNQRGKRPFDRWALPLGLSLGARIEELVGLRPQDIRQIDGIWAVAIQPTEDRRLKNSNSARTIPIPRPLINEGFLRWVERQSPEELLFPEPKPPAADPRLSHYASLRLSKIIRGTGITDPTAVFHSCRHFVAQQLTDAGVEQRSIEQICGHSSKSMTARYSRAGIPLPLLLEAMEARDWSWLPTS